jgi:hypothetical protein
MGRSYLGLPDKGIQQVLFAGREWDGAPSPLMKGYTLNRISSHSLRVGGAMAMKLSGASDSTIMQVGRWSLLTYLTYIHLQIGALTAGLLRLMATQVRFQNVG